jgi:hypothetical protein
MCFFQSQDKIKDAGSCMKAAGLCAAPRFQAKGKHRKGDCVFPLLNPRPKCMTNLRRSSTRRQGQNNTIATKHLII